MANKNNIVPQLPLNYNSSEQEVNIDGIKKISEFVEINPAEDLTSLSFDVILDGNNRRLPINLLPVDKEYVDAQDLILHNEITGETAERIATDEYILGLVTGATAQVTKGYVDQQDLILQNQITGETNLRISGDTNLQLQINPLTANSHIKNNDSQLKSPNLLHSINLDNNGTLHVENLSQIGSSFETHAEQILTKENLIILRDGAIIGLAPGEYVGFKAKLYDGINDGELIFDKDGWARVGDVGDTKKIATIEDTPTDGFLTYWDETSKTLKGISQNSFIKNNNSSAQSANMWINGKLRNSILNNASFISNWGGSNWFGIGGTTSTQHLIRLGMTDGEGVFQSAPGDILFQVDGAAIFASTINATQLQSTVATGTAPLTVNSTTLVSNLKAQYLGSNIIVADANLQTITGSYYYNTGSINVPFTGRLLHQGYNEVGYNGQIMTSETGNRMAFRTQTDATWNSWNEVYHSNNLTNNLSTNYLPKWNGSSFVNSLISDDGTTTTLHSTTQSTSPTTGALVVNGGVGAASSSTFGDSVNPPIKWGDNTSIYGVLDWFSTGNFAALYGLSGKSLTLGVNGEIHKFDIYLNGNTSIGYTVDQGYKLAVNGEGYFNGKITATELNTSSHLSVGLNTSTYNAARAELDVITISDDASDIWLGTNSIRRWAISARGSVDNNAFMLFNQSGIAQLTIAESSSATFIGAVTASNFKGSVQVPDNTSTADSTNVGTIRYRATSNASYQEMVMQTGVSTYEWVKIVEFNW